MAYTQMGLASGTGGVLNYTSFPKGKNKVWLIAPGTVDAIVNNI